MSRPRGFRDAHLFGPHWELRDYIPRPGDPIPPPARPSQTDGARRRWGNRVYMVGNPPNPGFPPGRNSATFVDTGDLGAAHAINVQVRFARADAQGNAILPFTPATPADFPSASDETVLYTIRRGYDPDGATAVDNFQQSGIAGDTAPFDTFTARSLGVDISHPGSNSFPLWVEVIATEVEAISQQNRVIGWAVDRATVEFVAAVATPGHANLLFPRADRAQFIIVNTSSSDLILKFSNTAAPPFANWTGPVGNVVLPGGNFSTYESPIGGFRGFVTGSWNAGAPNGGAIVTDGCYF